MESETTKSSLDHTLSRIYDYNELIGPYPWLNIILPRAYWTTSLVQYKTTMSLLDPIHG